MEKHPAMRHIAPLVLATALLGDRALGQPTNLPPREPATGLPVAEPGQLDPKAAAVNAARTTGEVQKLIATRRYAEALQRCLAFHEQFKTGGSLGPLLVQWVELGRKYPKAQAALLGIRDQGAREFSQGRGYFTLFREIKTINGYLHQDEATYALFKAFRDKDPGVAQQCYSEVEGLLVAKREYQWCYDHLGDPQERFDSIREGLRRHLDGQRRHRELLLRHGMTNGVEFSRPEISAWTQKSIQDRFVVETRRLIEILVATGHKTEAETIRDQAVTVLDDTRLKSAVTDALNQIRK